MENLTQQSYAMLLDAHESLFRTMGRVALAHQRLMGEPSPPATQDGSRSPSPALVGLPGLESLQSLIVAVQETASQLEQNVNDTLNLVS